MALRKARRSKQKKCGLLLTTMSSQVTTVDEEAKIVEQLEKIEITPEQEKPVSKMGGLLMKAHKTGELEAKVDAAEAAVETVELDTAKEAGPKVEETSEAEKTEAIEVAETQAATEASVETAPVVEAEKTKEPETAPVVEEEKTKEPETAPVVEAEKPKQE